MVRGCDYWAENGEIGSSVGGLVLLLSLSVIQFWFSLEWGCDADDMQYHVDSIRFGGNDHYFQFPRF